MDETRRASLRAYQAGIATSRKYDPNRQWVLKQRVFTTFDALLRHRGNPGLVPGMSLVDLGSADGIFVDICRKSGIRAQGFDASDGIDLEVDPLPLPDRSVDIITATSVIEHLHSPTRMLLESTRVLRPGGALILVTPNWHYSQRSFFDDPTHVHPYTPISLRKALAFHRFRDTYVVPWIVNKPSWMWDLPCAFGFARRGLLFRGDASRFIPGFLKGKSSAILALGLAPVSDP